MSGAAQRERKAAGESRPQGPPGHSFEDQIMGTSDPNRLTLSPGDREKLGAFRSAHAGGSGILKTHLAIAATTIALGLVPTAFFLILGWTAPGKQLEVGGYICGAVTLLPVVWLCFIARKFGWCLYLFENGFVLSQGACRVVLWDDVSALFDRQEVVFGARAERRIRLQLADGSDLTVENTYREFGPFADSVQAAVRAAILERCYETLRKGEAVSFGHLTLSPRGLRKDDKYKAVVRADRPDAPPVSVGGESEVLWPRVHGISVEPAVNKYVGGRMYAVVVHVRGQRDDGRLEEWFIQPVPVFPNFQAFLQVPVSSRRCQRETATVSGAADPLRRIAKGGGRPEPGAAPDPARDVGFGSR
jgi:hypothetical protein